MTKMGRPRVEICLSTLDRAARSGADQKRAAAELGVSLSTLKTRLIEDPAVEKIWHDGSNAALAARRAARLADRPTRITLSVVVNVDLAETLSQQATIQGISRHALTCRVLADYAAAAA